MQCPTTGFRRFGAGLRSTGIVVSALWLALGCDLACGDSSNQGHPDGSVDSAVSGEDASRRDAWIPPADPFGPRIFYSDLLGGPTTGGQDDKGAFVTLYGRGFGNSQGTSTVTAGGGSVAGYPIWTDVKLTFQLGPEAQTGEIVVHVPDKEPSNPLFLSVRQGRIFFVSLAGDDGNDGSYERPWRDLASAKRLLQPGDILYAMDGVTATAEDGPGTALCISQFYGCEAQAGTAELPIALVSYPGANVTVGCMESECPSNGVRVYAPHWTVAGLTIVGSGNTYAAGVSLEKAGEEPPSHGQRLVGNDVTGGYYGVTISTAMDCQVLGNHVHNTPNSAIYHGGWGPSANVEIAWNVVHDIGEEAFGIKAYGHTADDHLTGLWIHHNFVYNTQASAILVGGSDGNVPWVYDATIDNNVVWNVGGQWSSGIRIGNSGVDETELDVVIAHNTVVGASHSIAIAACKTARIQNNLFVQTTGTYVHGDLGVGSYLFDHNGYHGGDAVPSQDSSPVEGDPLFMDLAGGDFRLQVGSSAADTGVDAGIYVDFNGVRRPQNNGFDLGAYELVLP